MGRQHGDAKNTIPARNATARVSMVTALLGAGCGRRSPFGWPSERSAGLASRACRFLRWPARGQGSPPATHCLRGSSRRCSPAATAQPPRRSARAARPRTRTWQAQRAAPFRHTNPPSVTPHSLVRLTRLLPAHRRCGVAQLARWEWTSLSRSALDSHIEGYSPYQRCFPVLSIRTKLCPGRPACMPLPMVPYSVETVPSSSRKGVRTPLEDMSARICSLVFITMGSTVRSAAANAGSFSIWLIWTRQAWQPAPSLKYSKTFLPRSAARLTWVPEVLVRVKSGATRATEEVSCREVSIIAATIPITATVTPTQVKRIRRCRRRSFSAWAARSLLMCSWLAWAVSFFLVPVVISGSSLVDRGLFDGVLVAGGCSVKFRIVLWREGALPLAGAVPKCGVDEHPGQRQDDQAEKGLRDRGGHLLNPAEERGQTSTEGHLEPRP